MFALPEISDVVARALAEDLGVAPDTFSRAMQPDPRILERDATSWTLCGPNVAFEGVVVARESLVVAGLPVAERAWSTLARAAGAPGSVEVFPLVAEGSRVAAGARMGEVSGPASIVLAGERTALDLMMTLSGIATETARWQDAAGQNVAVCDTRKTVPGLRELSKYAVRVGGGTNHRMGLFDMALVKDNHLRAAGGIHHAVERLRSARPELLIEVEADTLEQAVEAVRAGADLVLLDNMADGSLAEAVAAVKHECARLGRIVATEASGGVTFERLAALCATGVDRVSTSAITLTRPVDLALDEV
jgi:nicotinate-nucleotide pyrophosphorylase (carboxylating)